MADRQSDHPKSKTLSGRLSTALDSGEDGKTIPRVFGEELKKRAWGVDAVRTSALSLMMGAFMGSMAGEIAYDVSDQSKPLEQVFSQQVQDDQGLRESEDSFTAVQIGNDIFFIARLSQDDNRYSLYTYDGGEEELHYVKDRSVALGIFYNIQQHIEAASEKLEAGDRLGKESLEFVHIKGLSELHIEEAGSLEREFTQATYDKVGYAGNIKRLDAHVEQAMQDILQDDVYGISQTSRDQVQDYSSREDYKVSGMANAAKGAFALLFASTMIGAGMGTRRRRKQAQAEKPKKPRTPK